MGQGLQDQLLKDQIFAGLIDDAGIDPLVAINALTAMKNRGITFGQGEIPVIKGTLITEESN